MSTTIRDRIKNAGNYTKDDLKTEVAKENWRYVHMMNHYLNSHMEEYLDNSIKKDTKKNYEVIKKAFQDLKDRMQETENDLTQILVVWEEANDEIVKQDGWTK